MRKAFLLLFTLLLATIAAFFYFGNFDLKVAKNTAEEITLETSEIPETIPSIPESPSVTPTPWPAENSDILADPAAVFGSLDNGMRYIILPNAEPPNRVSLRMHVDVGSLMERDEQRGLAHFLEHMVFNGTRTYKDANALIHKMQERGIAFGAHVNAYTSFDETVYMLDLPDLEEETYDLTFTIMRDFADGALLTEEEIEAERGVILSEKQYGDSVASRIQKKQFELLLPKSKISQRFPIGTEEVIKNASRELFLDLYEKYYIPSRITFVVVGDVDPGEIETRIQKTFGSMTNPEIPGEEPDLGIIEPATELKTSVFQDSELDSTDLSLLLVKPHKPQPDTIATRTAKLPIALASSILRRRFERLAKKENSPISSSYVGKFAWFNEVEFGSISVTVAEGRWQDAVPLLEQTFRQTLQFGFLKTELKEAKAKLLNAYQQKVEQKATRRSAAIASAIARQINDQTVLSTPETDLAIVEKALETLTTDDLKQAFNHFWENQGYHLMLTTKDKVEADAEAKLAELFTLSQGIALPTLKERTVAPFAYTDFGTHGTIAQKKIIEDLEITQLTLSNNVRVNLKRTDFRKNKINIFARIGSGQLSQPKNTPMLSNVASSIFNQGGLGKHSVDELSEILAGKNISSSLSITEDAFNLTGSTTPQDQRLQLQYMLAQLTDPGYRPESLWQFRKGIPAFYQNLKHTISGPMQEMQTWLHSNDFRYRIPNQKKLSNYDISKIRGWLFPELTSGYLEISIVGDFDEQQLTKDLLATFGSLPTRDKTLPKKSRNSRSVKMPKAPATKAFTYQTSVPQAAAVSIWPTNGMRGNIPETRRLNILASIFRDRIRAEIREKLGASYSPQAGASGSTALKKFGYLIGQSIGTSKDVPQVLSVMERISTELATKGATEDELKRAIAPTLKIIERSSRDNSYWLSTVLSESQVDPKAIEYARNRSTDYASISLEEINQLAAKYFNPKNLIKISILPTEKTD